MMICEGMWANDLEDLLQPIVSIDEYQSKVDNTAVAIGFFVSDRDAASDLNRFIQKSAVPLIDSDVSPAPDQRGFYLVFVEFPDNDRLAENIVNICDEVGQLGGIEAWQMKMRGFEHTEKLAIKRIHLGVLRNRVNDRLEALNGELEAIRVKKSTTKGVDKPMR